MNNSWAVSFLLLSLILMVGCEKETGLSSTSIYSLAADVNGQHWKADKVQGLVMTIDSSIVLIEGVMSATESPEVVIKLPSTKSGRYKIGPETSLSYGDGKTGFLSVSGSIVISVLPNKRLMGSFNAICINNQNSADSVIITNGNFITSMELRVPIIK